MNQHPGPAASRHRVLLIEDSQADVFLIETSIETADLPLHLIVACDGLDALELLEIQRRDGLLPDLVLLDLNMPRMNGFEVLAALREHPDYQHLPAVVLTTSAARPDQLKAHELGARAFTTKPHNFTQLTGLLEQVVAALRGHTAWATLESTPV